MEGTQGTQLGSQEEKTTGAAKQSLASEGMERKGEGTDGDDPVVFDFYWCWLRIGAFGRNPRNPVREPRRKKPTGAAKLS